MTYELAKQLKDAGFPHSLDIEVLKLGEGYIAELPTLSELIEACPKTSGNPKMSYDFVLQYWGEDEWLAGYIQYDSYDIQIIGKTPEEAVARLWLELNKK